MTRLVYSLTIVIITIVNAFALDDVWEPLLFEDFDDDKINPEFWHIVEPQDCSK